MLGAMRQGGVVVGVLADSLLKAATSAKWRKGLMDEHLVLVSPFYPEAGFNAGNAMARNKYIYCLAESSLVIHSGKKGGTISGAEENLKKAWVPLWVKPTTDKDAANADLVTKGGQWCEAEVQGLKISDLFEAKKSAVNPAEKGQDDLFSMPAETDLFAESEPKREPEVFDAEQDEADLNKCANQVTPAEPIVESEAPKMSPVNFYQVFITQLQRLAPVPTKMDDLIDVTGLNKAQLIDWLKRAEADGVVEKLNRPVRYRALDK
jgi:predicted Rossmann fold nucleotide-binding protein DprA/Smf involved in DNA uptake